MADTVLTTKLYLQGAKEYREGVASSSRELKVMQAELKKDTAALGANASEQDKAKVKAESLKKQIEAQKKLVEQHKKRLEEAKKAYGDNSKEVDRLKVTLANSETALHTMQNELTKTTDSLKQTKQAAKETGDELLRSIANNVAFTTGVEKFKLLASAAKGALSSIGSFASGIITNIEGIVTSTAQTADDLLTLSTNSGVSMDTVSKLFYASNAGYDVNYTTFTGAAQKLKTSRNTLSGAGMFDAGGLMSGFDRVTLADGSTRSATNEELMWAILNGAAQAKANGGGVMPTEWDTVLQSAFGKSYGDFGTFLDNPQGLEEIIQHGLEKGLILDADQWAEIGKINDNLDLIRAAAQAMEQLFVLLFAEDFQNVTGDYANLQEAIAAYERALVDGDGQGIINAKDQMATAAESLVTSISTLIDHMLEELGKTISALASETGENGEPTTIGNIFKVIQNIFNLFKDFNLKETVDGIIETFSTITKVVNSIAAFLGIRTTQGAKDALAENGIDEATGEYKMTYANTAALGNADAAGRTKAGEMMEAWYDVYREWFNNGSSADDPLYQSLKTLRGNIDKEMYANDPLWDANKSLTMFDNMMDWFDATGAQDLPSTWTTVSTSLDSMTQTLEQLPAQVSGSISGMGVYMDGTSVGHIISPTVGSDLAAQAVGTFAFEG